MSEDEDRDVHITHKFKSFTYWNLDSKPNCNDAFQNAMQWPSLAKAVSENLQNLLSPPEMLSIESLYTCLSVLITVELIILT